MMAQVAQPIRVLAAPLIRVLAVAAMQGRAARNTMVLAARLIRVSEDRCTEALVDQPMTVPGVPLTLAQEALVMMALGVPVTLDREVVAGGRVRAFADKVFKLRHDQHNGGGEALGGRLGCGLQPSSSRI